MIDMIPVHDASCSTMPGRPKTIMCRRVHLLFADSAIVNQFVIIAQRQWAQTRHTQGTHTWGNNEQTQQLFNNISTPRRMRDVCGLVLVWLWLCWDLESSVAHVMLELSKPKSTSINHRKFINYSVIDNGCVSLCVCECVVWVCVLFGRRYANCNLCFGLPTKHRLKYAWGYLQIDACPCQQKYQDEPAHWLHFYF